MFILFFEWKIKEVGLKLVFRYLCDLMRVRKMFTFQSTKISHCPEKPEMHCCHYFIQLLLPNYYFTLSQIVVGRKNDF